MAFNTIRHVENGATRIAYAVVEPTRVTKPTICLIASTGRGPDDFAELAELLAAEGFKVLLPWPRGSGGTVGSLEDIDFHDLASDAGAVIQAESPPKWLSCCWPCLWLLDRQNFDRRSPGHD